MYRVALVGHSNLPVFPGWENVQVEIFKVNGAKLTDLRDEQRFGRALFTTNWDCVVIFLGGNDVANAKILITCTTGIWTRSEFFIQISW